jgi:hypothetical protein
MFVTFNLHFKISIKKLKLIQSTGFFKSKTVDYSRHKGLDQHCLVDIFDYKTHLQLQ